MKQAASTGELAAWRASLGQGIVPAVVAGTFDILQPGNAFALRRAAEQSPPVCVLVESDALAKTHTSQGRPQNGLAARMELVSRLRAVRVVTVVDAATASSLFHQLAPCVLVVAREQRSSDVPAAAAAGAGAGMVELDIVPGCFTEEIRAAIASGRTPLKLPEGSCSGADAGPAVAPGPRSGRRLVTVNGCFDVLHVGHARFLEQARALGTELIVLLNDDASVSAYKGTTRPVFPLAFRMAALRMFECVTDVVPFSGGNPLEALARLRPDVHVKGGSFEPDRVRQERELVESWGGSLVGTPLVEGYSTTKYIQSAAAQPPS